MNTSSALSSPKILESIQAARNGDPIAAVSSAMLIHMHKDKAVELGCQSQYERMLEIALSANEPELLVCIGEELIRAYRLAPDGKLADRFFSKADKLSSFMGSYAKGMLFSSYDRELSIKLFRVGAKHGHIPSMINAHKLRAISVPILGIFIRLYYGFLDYFVVRSAIKNRERIYERFWRYRDVFRLPLSPIDQEIGVDRKKPSFPDPVALN